MNKIFFLGTLACAFSAGSMGANHGLPDGFPKPDVITPSGHQTMIDFNCQVEQNPEQSSCENVSGCCGTPEEAEALGDMHDLGQEKLSSTQQKARTSCVVEFFNSIGLDWIADHVARTFCGCGNLYDKNVTLVRMDSEIRGALLAVTPNSEIVREYGDWLIHGQEIRLRRDSKTSFLIAETPIGVSTEFLERIGLKWIPLLAEEVFPGFNNLYARSVLISSAASKIYESIINRVPEAVSKLIRSESSSSIQVPPSSPNPVVASGLLEIQNSPNMQQIPEGSLVTFGGGASIPHKINVITPSSHQVMIGFDRQVWQNPGQSSCANADSCYGTLEDAEVSGGIYDYKHTNLPSMQQKARIFCVVEFFSSIDLDWITDYVARTFSGYGNLYDKSATLVRMDSKIRDALSRVTRNSKRVHKYENWIKQGQETRCGNGQETSFLIAETPISVSTEFLDSIGLGWIPLLAERGFPGFHNLYLRSVLISSVASKLHELIINRSPEAVSKLTRSESSSSIQVPPSSPNPVMAHNLLELQNSPKMQQIPEGSPVIFLGGVSTPPRTDSAIG
jgi:hypothetical protein